METARLYDGTLENLPGLESSVVRVFLSSTFTDMSSERNEILTVAVPELRNFCLGKGLEFEICDMRWGVRDDASISHSTSDICLKELKTCQQISQGPNFVAVLGNKYGYCPYPSHLGVEEFTTLDNLIRSQDSNDADLINRWFRKDTNAMPPMYILQPITDILKHYGDMNPSNTELFERDQQEWRKIDSELSRILRNASQVAFQHGLMTEENKHGFHRSITEHEIDVGVFRAAKKERVLCFTRDIPDIDSTDKLAGRYMDLTCEGELKKTSIDLLDKLKTDRLPTCLNEEQIHRYSVGWLPGGVTPESPQHQDYLVKFREAFISRLKDMIVASQTDRSKNDGPFKVYEEVLHHLNFCQKKCKNFQGRGQLITRVQMAFGQVFKDKHDIKEVKDEGQEEQSDEEISEMKRLGAAHAEYAGMASRYKELGVGYFMEDYNAMSDPNKNEKLECLDVDQDPSSYTKPLVIHGESGCGKTALMAKVAEVISVWSPRSAWLVRFLGTSPQSSTIRDSLASICYQIYKIYDLEPPHFDIKEDFPFLVQYFNALLWKIDSRSKPLYILLDSLDQLNNSDHAYSLSWLPTKLPENVHIVVSTLPEMHDILANLKSRLNDDSLFFEVHPLPVSDASDLLFKVWSRTAKREFTQPQRQLLKSQISSGGVPLYLKLLFYQAAKWHSYTDVTNVQLAQTAQAAINQLFDDLEILHGKTLINKAFGYITAAKTGLSNQEMEHLLSLDDEVLQDVYLYHLPPNENSIMLPSLIWRRVVYDLDEYLVDRRADGRTVKTWYHRQFHVVAADRYLKGNQKVKIHSAMVEYFLGIWSNRAKPLELYKLKTGHYPNAMRQVPEQPIVLAPSVFNLRKLTELPHHLVFSQQFAEFRALVACNIEWLYSKCKAVGLSEALQDLQLAVNEGSKYTDSTSSRKGENSNLADILSDLQFVYEMLVIGSDNIRKNPINVPIQVLGQIGSTYKESLYLERLAAQSLEFCNLRPHPILIPQHPCLPSPGGNIKLSINVGVESPGAFRNSTINRGCLAIRDDRYLLVAEMGGNLRDCDKLKSFDLKDGQCVFTSELKHRTVHISLVNDNRYVRIVWTTNRDDYNPTCYQKLLLTSSLAPVNLPDNVKQLSFSPSGNLLAYSVDCDIFVKPANSLLTDCQKAKQFKITLAEPVCNIIISPDDKYMVTTTIKKIQMVWSLETKVMLHELHSAKDEFMSSEFELDSTLITKNNWLICPGMRYVDSGKIYVTDIETGKLIFTFEGSSKYESHIVRLHPSESCVLFGNKSSVSSSNSGDKHAHLWSLNTGKQITECSAAEGPYSDLQIFGTDQIFIASSHLYKDPVINLHWAGTEAKPQASAVLVRVLVAHNDSIIQLLLTQDKLISASKDNTVKVWDLAEIQKDLLPALKNCENPDEVRFLSSLSEGKLPVPGRDTIKTTAMVVCQNRAVVGSQDGFIIFYDLETSEMLSYLKLSENKVVAMVTSKDDEHIVVAAKKTIFVIKSNEDKVKREILVPTTVDCLAEANNIIVAGHAGMEAYGYAWNLDTGEAMGKFQGLYGFQCIAINSDGTRVAGSFFEYPALYALDTGEILTTLEGADVMMTGQSFVLFSPDDRYLVGGSTDGSIRVIDGHSGKYLQRFQQLSSSIAGCFSTDSKILVTSGWRTIYLWSIEQGTLLRSITRHEDFVVKLTFSVDGRYLVTCSKDKQIIVWNWSGLYSVAVYMAHCPIDVMAIAGDLSSVIYAPDSVHYVSILKPNKYMLQKMGGQLRSGVPSELQDAQALALSFSSQGLKRETTQACALL